MCKRLFLNHGASCLLDDECTDSGDSPELTDSGDDPELTELTETGAD